MNTELWKTSTERIYLGVRLYYIGGILAVLFGLISSANTMSSFMDGGSSSFDGAGAVENLMKIAVVAGAVLFFLGLKEFRGVVDSADTANVNKLYHAIILIIVGAVVNFIPLMGWISGILNIIAMIFMLMSFSGLKQSQTFPTLAKKGASQLFNAMILSIVAVVIGWIPFVGGFIGIVLSAIALYFIIYGWKNISLGHTSQEQAPSV